MPDNNFAGLRAPLEAIMREAGELARETSRRPFKRWTKGDDNSPVSEGDIAVNDLLRAQLTKLLPGAGWLSEETVELPDSALPLAWVVDPIDGTRAYIAGRADWSISVALVEAGRPRLAALFAPASEEMFLAMHGEGATLNGVRMVASGGATLASAKLAGPKRYLEKLAALDSDRPAAAAGAFAGAAHRARRPRRTRRRLCLARQPRLGPGRGRPSGARSRRPVHRFYGQPLLYSARHVAHGALLAAGNARHGTLIGLVRNRLGEFA